MNSRLIYNIKTLVRIGNIQKNKRDKRIKDNIISGLALLLVVILIISLKCNVYADSLDSRYDKLSKNVVSESIQIDELLNESKISYNVEQGSADSIKRYKILSNNYYLVSFNNGLEKLLFDIPLSQKLPGGFKDSYINYDIRDIEVEYSLLSDEQYNNLLDDFSTVSISEIDTEILSTTTESIADGVKHLSVLNGDKIFSGKMLLKLNYEMECLNTFKYSSEVNTLYHPIVLLPNESQVSNLNAIVDFPQEVFDDNSQAFIGIMPTTFEQRKSSMFSNVGISNSLYQISGLSFIKDFEDGIYRISFENKDYNLYDSLYFEGYADSDTLYINYGSSNLNNTLLLIYFIAIVIILTAGSYAYNKYKSERILRTINGSKITNKFSYMSLSYYYNNKQLKYRDIFLGILELAKMGYIKIEGCFNDMDEADESEQGNITEAQVTDSTAYTDSSTCSKAVGTNIIISKTNNKSNVSRKNELIGLLYQILFADSDRITDNFRTLYDSAYNAINYSISVSDEAMSGKVTKSDKGSKFIHSLYVVNLISAILFVVGTLIISVYCNNSMSVYSIIFTQIVFMLLSLTVVFRKYVLGKLGQIINFFAEFISKEDTNISIYNYVVTAIYISASLYTIYSTIRIINLGLNMYGYLYWLVIVAQITVSLYTSISLYTVRDSLLTRIIQGQLDAKSEKILNKPVKKRKIIIDDLLVILITNKLDDYLIEYITELGNYKPAWFTFSDESNSQEGIQSLLDDNLSIQNLLLYIEYFK